MFEKLIKAIQQHLTNNNFQKQIEVTPQADLPALYLIEYAESADEYIKEPPTFTGNQALRLVYVSEFKDQASFYNVARTVETLQNLLHNADDAIKTIDQEVDISIEYRSKDFELFYEQESATSIVQWEIEFKIQRV